MERRHCACEKVCRYVVPAEDSLKDGTEPPPLAKLQIAELNEKSSGGLRDQIELAIGMKAMVISNVATKADVANGTRGTIEEIILDPRESEINTPDTEGRIFLKFPPALILFWPSKETDITHAFPSSANLKVAKGLVPITLSLSTPCIVSCVDSKKYSIYRWQFASVMRSPT